MWLENLTVSVGPSLCSVSRTISGVIPGAISGTIVFSIGGGCASSVEVHRVHKKPCDVLQGVFVSYKSWSFLNIRDSFRNLRKCRLQLQNSVNVMKQSRVEQRWLFMLQNVWQWQNVLTVTVLREPTLFIRIFCSVLYCGSSWWVRNKNWNNDLILFVQDSCLASSCFPTHCFAPSSGRPWSAPAPPAYPGHLRHLPLQLLHHHAPDKVCPQFMLSCHDGVDFQIYR